ncbi:hypothetical protein ACMFMG_012164 [Clarireedia jacksonii]
MLAIYPPPWNLYISLYLRSAFLLWALPLVYLTIILLDFSDLICNIQVWIAILVVQLTSQPIGLGRL